MAAGSNGEDNYNISAIRYTLESTPTGGESNLQVYMAKSDATTLTVPLKEEEMTLVYSGIVKYSDVVDNELTIELDSPFAMKADEGLVIGIIGGYKEWAIDWNFKMMDYGDIMFADRTLDAFDSDPIGFDAIRGAAHESYYVPALAIQYETGAVSDEFSVKVTIDGPAATYSGQENEYTVTVANKGTADLSDYKVNLLDADKNVVASTDGVDVAVGESAEVKVTYTFEQPGSYTLFGQVVKGDYTPVRSAGLSVEVEKPLPEGLSFGNFPEPQEGVSSMFFIYRLGDYSASQTLLPAEYFSDFVSAIDIQTLGFEAVNVEWERQPINLTVSFAQVDRTESYTANPELVPEEDFTVVYSGELNTKPAAEKLYTLILDTPYTLEKGKSLVVNVSAENNDNDFFNVKGATLEEAYMAYTTRSTNIYNATKVNTQMVVPALRLGYTAAAVEEMVDLSVTAGTWAEEAETDAKVNFPVTVENVGTVDVEEFTVLLLNYVSESEEPEVLASKDYEEYLTPGTTYNARVAYTFTKGGEYKLAARVVAEGDNVFDNDTTEIHLVSVKGDDTGINAVNTDGSRAEVYNLMGVRVENTGDLAPGIYIVNGKKVIVRK